MVARISPYPIPELKEFLRPFRPHFYRCESLPVLERYATGLLADIARKSGAGIAEAVAGLSESAVYRLLAQSTWDEAAVNRQRIGIMVAQATAGDGMLVFDETSFPRQGPEECRCGPSVLRCLGQDGQLPGGGDRALPGSLLRLAGLGPTLSARSVVSGPGRCATGGYRRS